MPLYAIGTWLPKQGNQSLWLSTDIYNDERWGHGSLRLIIITQFRQCVLKNWIEYLIIVIEKWLLKASFKVMFQEPGRTRGMEGHVPKTMEADRLR